MAKLKAGRLCREVTDSCLQFWGGMGFVTQTPITRATRDLRLVSIGGGADAGVQVLGHRASGVIVTGVPAFLDVPQFGLQVFHPQQAAFQDMEGAGDVADFIPVAASGNEVVVLSGGLGQGG